MEKMHRRTLRPWLALSTLFFWGATSRAEQPLASRDWPRFLNVQFDGVAAVDGERAVPISKLDWRADPVAAWSLDVGDGYALGVAADGYYFHFDANSDIERLRKIELATGKEIWTSGTPLRYRDLYGYEAGPRCSPTIAGDVIVTLGVAGLLTCRRVTDGETLWSVDTTDQYGVVQNFFGVGSSPLVVDDQVIAMVGGSPAEDQAIAPGQLDRVSPNGSLLVSFDLNTGQERWRTGDDLASYSSPRTMMLEGRQVVLLLARDFLHVVDSQSGKVLGRIRHRADILESVNAMVPVVDGNDIFISDCYDLGGVRLRLSPRGDDVVFEEVWRDPPGSRRGQSLRSHMSTPVLVNGYLYACSGRNAGDSDFRCVRWSDGEVAWTALTGVRSTATRLGDVLLVLKETGELNVVRCTPEKFDLLGVWSLEQAAGDRPAVTFPSWAAPVVVGDRVLVLGDQTLVCLMLPEATQ